MSPHVGLAGDEAVELLAEPGSVVVLGASATAGSYSNRAITFLKERGFAGQLSLVNPNHDSIEGLACYRAVAEIPGQPASVGLVAVSASRVIAGCRELAEAGIRIVVVFAAGLTATDKQALKALTDETGMRILGADSIGSASVGSGAYLTFSRVAARAPAEPGSIAMVTQSGAMGNSILISLFERGISFSHWFSSGGEIDLGALELTAGLLTRDDVSAVALYLEGLTDAAWAPQVRQLIQETGKPVFAVKGAVSAAGRQAAAGHTGKVVGSAELTRAVLKEAGMVLLPTIPAMVDALTVHQRLPETPGPRVAVVTVSGGAGVLTADAVASCTHLSMADIANEPRLRAMRAGRVTHIANPLDAPVGDEKEFCRWISAVAESPSTDAVIAVQGRLMHADVAFTDALLSLRTPSAAPVIVTSFNEDELLGHKEVSRLGQHGIPFMATPERAVAALDAVRRARGCAVLPSQATPGAGEMLFGIERARSLLPSLPWSPFETVSGADAAASVAERLGFPVVIKAAGRTITHRTELAAVAVNVARDGLADAYQRVASVCQEMGDAVLVQAQATSGVEVLVTALKDPEIGSVVVLRPGGQLTELGSFQNTVLWGRWPRGIWRRSLEGTALGQLLIGYRRDPGYDADALLDLAEQLRDAVDDAIVSFLELNPVVVGRQGVCVVDALLLSG